MKPLTALISLLLLATTANADGSLRCKGRLVEPGVPMGYVLEQCGPPKYGIIETAPARSRLVTGFSRLSGTFVSEQWIYDRGYGRFPAVLKFVDGTLRRIDYLPERTGQTR